MQSTSWETLHWMKHKLETRLPGEISIISDMQISSVQFSSVTQSCLTLCEPMNQSTPGLPVHHQLLEFTQIHVHRVSDAIQISHPLSSPSPPAFNLSQDQGLFKWVSSSHSICQQIWKPQQWPQDWKRSVFIPIPKKGNAKECSNYHTIALISHASNVQNSPSQASAIREPWTSWIQAGFRKGRETRDQIANISWIIEKAREFLPFDPCS